MYAKMKSMRLIFDINVHLNEKCGQICDAVLIPQIKDLNQVSLTYLNLCQILSNLFKKIVFFIKLNSTLMKNVFFALEYYVYRASYRNLVHLKNKTHYFMILKTIIYNHI